jgi:hypothetical protein
MILRGALIGALLTAAGMAEENRLPAVKGLYLDRAHNAGANGMRFDIELERPDGRRVEVPVTYEFHSGDRIWLRMDVRNHAYVYVLNRTLNGDDKGIATLRDEDQRRPPSPAELPRLVFGPEKLNRGTARLAPKTGALRFDNNPGIEKLYVILSPKPLQLDVTFDPEGRVLSDDSHRDAVENLDRRMAEWASNADVAVPDKNGAKGLDHDNYGYCVERRPNEVLMLELTVNHSR